jgi:hypothetical protein
MGSLEHMIISAHPWYTTDQNFQDCFLTLCSFSLTSERIEILIDWEHLISQGGPYSIKRWKQQYRHKEKGITDRLGVLNILWNSLCCVA